MKSVAFKYLEDGQKFILVGYADDDVATVYVKTRLSDRGSSEKRATNLKLGLTLEIADDTQVIPIDL